MGEGFVRCSATPLHCGVLLPQLAVDFPGAAPRLDAVLRPLLPDEPVPPRCTVRRPQRQSGPALAQGLVLQIPP
ncbi:hypothetical protein D3C85_1056590 [compost metagenome]